MRDLFLGFDKSKVLGQVLHAVLLVIELGIDQGVLVTPDASKHPRRVVGLLFSSWLLTKVHLILLHSVTFHDAPTELLAFVHLILGRLSLAE